MKHIRKFNESISTDIQEFCNNNLAYLIDDGYIEDIEVLIHKITRRLLMNITNRF
jgi:phage gp46-like protein